MSRYDHKIEIQDMRLTVSKLTYKPFHHECFYVTGTSFTRMKGKGYGKEKVILMLVS